MYTCAPPRMRNIQFNERSHRAKFVDNDEISEVRKKTIPSRARSNCKSSPFRIEYVSLIYPLSRRVLSSLRMWKWRKLSGDVRCENVCKKAAKIVKSVVAPAAERRHNLIYCHRWKRDSFGPKNKNFISGSRARAKPFPLLHKIFAKLYFIEIPASGHISLDFVFVMRRDAFKIFIYYRADRGWQIRVFLGVS